MTGEAAMRTVALRLVVALAALYQTVEPPGHGRLASPRTISRLLHARVVQDGDVLQKLVDLVVDQPLSEPPQSG